MILLKNTYHMLKSYNGQTIITFLGMVFLQLVNFISLILISRGLSPAEVGRYQLLLSVAVVLSLITKMGLDEGLSYYLPRYLQSRTKHVNAIILYCTVLTFSLSCIAGLSFYLFSSHINAFLFKLEYFDKTLKMLLYILPSLVFSLIGLSILRGLGRSDIRAYIYYFFMSGCFFAGILFMSRNTFQVETLLLWRACTFAFGGGVAFIFIYLLNRQSYNFPPKKTLKNLHFFSISVIFVNLLQYLVEQPLIDLAIISRFLTPTEVGTYAIAARIGALVALGFNAMTIVMVPRIVSAVNSGDNDLYKSIYQSSNKKLLWLTSCCVGVLFLSLDFIIGWFGEQYLAGKPVTLIFIVGYFVLALTGLNLPFMLSFNKQKAELLLGLLSLSFMIIGGFWGIKLFGVTGVATATVLSLIVLNILRHTILSKSSLLPRMFSWNSFGVVMICGFTLWGADTIGTILPTQTELIVCISKSLLFLITFSLGIFWLERFESCKISPIS